MNNIHYNNISRRIGLLETLLFYEDDSVIRKVGNKWKILKKDRKHYWDADYNTKKDAEAALRAYWANKRESLYHSEAAIIKDQSWLDILGSLFRHLKKIFGSWLYFDHETNTDADLYYKGRKVADLMYDRIRDEITVFPEDSDEPEIFSDRSLASIKDYLTELVLGDYDPSIA